MCIRDRYQRRVHGAIQLKIQFNFICIQVFMEKHFSKSISKLESLIHELEVNVGVQHTKSPFNIKIKEPVIQAKQEEEKKVSENKEKKQINQIVSDYSSFELRIGEITECKKIENSDKLYAETISLGKDLGTRQIASGLQQFVPLGDMNGLCLVFVNLKSKKLAGFASHGMILCASNNDHSKVEIMRPDSAKIGERVQLENQDIVSDENIKEITPKEKEIWKMFEQFKVDENSFATFQGVKLKTSTGYIKCKTLQKCQIS
eukprot:TRINITY_DN1422_c0_g1_i3.p1 TRINITY_DN1422_c0_g1~~TRINITY_DN1422_c0_g1_i3.p1  ORF type:complete len:260 (+),score=57.07 TRINITY_DN1422_c0_g1_i3:131-910(+)